MDFANHLNAFSIPRSTEDSGFQDSELHSVGLLWPLERTLSECTHGRVCVGHRSSPSLPTRNEMLLKQCERGTVWKHLSSREDRRLMAKNS